MDMNVDEEEFEMSMVYGNFGSSSPRNPSLKNSSKERSGEETATAPVSTEAKLCQLASVSIGLICILQVALNISLRLLLSSQHYSLTEERDKLKMPNFGIEAQCNNLTEERDELKRKLDNITSQCHFLTEARDNLTRTNSAIMATLRNVTEERDQLNRTIYYVEASNKHLTEERDALKRNLTDLVSQHHFLTEARDNLTRTNSGWIHFLGHAYYISPTVKTWNESRDDCHQKGADLMIINSREEQSFANEFKKYMWISLTDSETEGAWRWVDGTRLTTSYWSSGEPNGARNENCGQIKIFNSQNSWNDEGCSTSHFWICEKRASP